MLYYKIKWLKEIREEIRDGIWEEIQDGIWEEIQDGIWEEIQKNQLKREKIEETLQKEQKE